MSALTAGSALAVVLPLILLFGFLLHQGASAVNVDFFTRLPKPVGEAGGGMANAIVGSLILIALAGALGLPPGILGGGDPTEARDRRPPARQPLGAGVLHG